MKLEGDGRESSQRTFRETPTITSRFRRVQPFILAIVALLTLASGSVFVAAALIGVGNQESYVGARYDAASFAVLLIWLPVLVIVCLLETLALLLVRQFGAMRLFLAACAATAVVSLVTIFSPQVQLPVQGASAAFTVMIFFAINAGAICITWRYVFH
jgi:hypothetical protein